RPGSFHRKPEILRDTLGKRKQRFTLRLRADEASEMHHAIANRDVAVAKTGPRLVFESRQQLEPDLAVRFVVLIHAADHRRERLDQVGAADYADELPSLTTGTRLIRLRSNRVAISESGVSSDTETAPEVMISRTFL